MLRKVLVAAITGMFVFPIAFAFSNTSSGPVRTAGVACTTSSTPGADDEGDRRCVPVASTVTTTVTQTFFSVNTATVTTTETSVDTRTVTATVTSTATLTRAVTQTVTEVSPTTVTVTKTVTATVTKSLRD